MESHLSLCVPLAIDEWARQGGPDAAYFARITEWKPKGEPETDDYAEAFAQAEKDGFADPSHVLQWVACHGDALQFGQTSFGEAARKRARSRRRWDIWREPSRRWRSRPAA